MIQSFAALIFRPAEVSDRALSQSFAVALAGFDVPSPHLTVAEVRAIPGYQAAFYASGARSLVPEEEFEHAAELFEEELSPGLAVLDAAAEEGHTDAVIFGLVYAEELIHDDGFRFDKGGVHRKFVHATDDGILVGFESPEDGGAREIKGSEGTLTEGARPHRGSTYLSAELGVKVVPSLMAALFEADKRVVIRLAPKDPPAIEAEVERLNRALRRVSGRGAPADSGGPLVYQAFVRTYDWADPSDPSDLYRELAIGAIEGTLRFLRPFERVPGLDLHPIAKLSGSSLGGGGERGYVALAQDEDHLILVKPSGARVLAGPTFGELLRYLALGFSKRTGPEEDMITALMLRARLRLERGTDTSAD